MRYFLTLGIGALLVSAPALIHAQPSPTGGKKAPEKKAKAAPVKQSKAEAPSASASASKTKTTSKVKKTKNAVKKGKTRPKSPAESKGPAVAGVETRTTLKSRDGDGRVSVLSRAPSVQGATGLDRLWSADTGPVGTIRARLGLSWFSADDFPVDGASNLFLGTHLAAAYTPHPWVETFLGFKATSNTNESEQPSLIQTQGDLTLGVKGSYPVTPTIQLGAALATRFLSGMGSGGLVGGATSVDLRLLSTFDLARALEIPLRIHFELGNYFENSEAVTEDLAEEPSLVQEFGLQVARYDRLTLGLGIESPINEYVTPFLEYQIAKPHYVELSRRGEGSQEYTLSSVPHSLALGVRGFPQEHLALDLAVRIGLSDAPHTGVPATPPYMILFGVAYTLDPRPKLMTQVVEKTVKVPAPKAAVANGQLAGQVIDAKSKRPVNSARIRYRSQSGISPQITGKDGRFSGYRFEPGVIEFTVDAPGYKPGTGKATVAIGKTANAQVALEIDPAQQAGKVEIRIFGQRGKAITATLAFAGKASGIAGAATKKAPFRETLPAGRHPVTITAKGYKTLTTRVIVKGAQSTPYRFTLVKGGASRPRTAMPQNRNFAAPPPSKVARGRLASVSARGIKLKRRISFEANRSKVTAEGQAVLSDVARGLKRVKSIKQVRINAHVAGQGSRDRDSRLSIARAKAVKAFLVKKGVSSSRLQARGLGGLNPVAPSITARGRARNERIDFIIIRK
jgi:outer membrane protein OmpA-like peptidoglycan-associated protein